MSQRQQFSTFHLLIRSLTPSGASAFFCIVLAIVLVGTNIVLQSVSVGTSLPGILDGQWSIAYTDYIVRPLTQLLNSNTLNKFLIAGLWGLAGFVAYIGFEYWIHTIHSLRESRTNIRMARGGRIEKPMAESFWHSIAWRLGVIFVSIMLIIMLQPLLRDAMSVADAVILSNDLYNSAARVLRAIAEWALLMHVFVVMIRLYTMRTRIFGDDKLY